MQRPQPWFTVFEVSQGPYWDQSMCWTEFGWKTFSVDTLQQLSLPKVLEFCLIIDATSGAHWKEEEESKTEAQRQRENDRASKRIATLYYDDTNWRINPGSLALEMRGDSQCIIRWLTGKNRYLNEIYSQQKPPCKILCIPC
eukprot:9480982-Pyramimonas_sp.AAC.1